MSRLLCLTELLRLCPAISDRPKGNAGAPEAPLAYRDSLLPAVQATPARAGSGHVTGGAAGASIRLWVVLPETLLLSKVVMWLIRTRRSWPTSRSPTTSAGGSRLARSRAG